MLKPGPILEHVKQRSTELTEMYAAATRAEIDVDARDVYLRPSMLPVCSVSLLDGILHHRLGYTDTAGFGSDYFTSVGTTVHSVVERWCARSGYRMWGNWRCSNEACRRFWRHTDRQKCDRCGSDGLYHEITIEYLGFRGHIDCIILTPTGVLVGDYKTSSSYGIGKATFRDHNLAYPLQITSYSYMLDRVWGAHFEREYGLAIRGCSLLFICRDNPFKTREFHWPARFALPTGRRILVNGYIAWRAAQRALESRDIASAVRRRACSDAADYRNRVGKFFCYEPCPMLDVCVGSRRRGTSELEEYFQALFTELDTEENP